MIKKIRKAYDQLSPSRRDFLRRTILSLVVLSLIYAIWLVFLRSDEKQVVVHDNKPRIKVLLDRHSLTLGSLFLIDGSDPAASFYISQSLNYREESRKNLEDEVNNLGDESLRAKISEQLVREDELLARYLSDYESVKKLVEFVPAGVLTGEGAQIDQRTEEARNEITKKIASSPIISNETEKTSTEINKCLTEVESSSSKSKTVKKCNLLYHSFRQAVLNDLNTAESGRLLSKLATDFGQLTD